MMFVDHMVEDCQLQHRHGALVRAQPQLLYYQCFLSCLPSDLAASLVLVRCFLRLGPSFFVLGRYPIRSNHRDSYGTHL